MGAAQESIRELGWLPLVLAPLPWSLRPPISTREAGQPEDPTVEMQPALGWTGTAPVVRSSTMQDPCMQAGSLFLSPVQACRSQHLPS